MKKTREEKAITLIALIITIVVLLILAVVAINAVTGDGIIQHATNAKIEYEQAQTEEEMLLSSYEAYLKGNVDTWDGESKKEPTIKEGDWYIYTCSEFKFFADFVNKTPGIDTTGIEEITADTTVYLMSNLDLGAKQADGELKSGTEWEPIGSSSTISFEGTFEGNNHYITGVYVNDEDGLAGIFGYSKNGEIRNLTIKDSYIESAGWCTGGIIGRGEKVVNCHNINTEVKITNEYYVGGIAGQVTNIESCTNTGNVSGSGTGLNNVQGNTDNAIGIGGIAGGLKESVKKCKNSGIITATEEDIERIGGIIGTTNSTGTIIESCINTGTVSGDESIGGILGVVGARTDDGTNNITITNCYNIGNVIGNYEIGGIIGNLAGTAGNGKIKGCYNLGEVSGTFDIGAIVGAIGTTTGNTIAYCYYLEGTSSVGISGITESEEILKVKTEAEMKTKGFADLLNAATNTGAWVGSDTDYPKLSWE